MKFIYVDFETRSDVPIKLGATAYVSHLSFRPVLLAYAVNGGRIMVTDDFSKVPAAIAQAMTQDHEFVAHNAEFDRAVFRKVFKSRKSEWIDTAAACRALSIPASLDSAAEFHGIGRKLDTGKALLKKLEKGETLEKAEQKALREYAMHDVRLLRWLHLHIGDPIGGPLWFIYRVHKLHLDMNRSGISVNQTRTRKLLEAIENEKTRLTAQAVKKFGTYGKDKKPVACSADQVKKFLAARGVPVESIAEKDLEDFLSVTEKKLPKDCVELLSYYREIQSRGADKLRLIAGNNMRRIHDSSIFHGTHTGRPAGGGINLLNVKRTSGEDEGMPFDRALSRILKTGQRGERVKRLSSLLWGCFEPESGEVMVRSDLSAIEPRVGAWLRQDSRVLGIYSAADAGTGKDEYTIFGESMGFPAKISRNLSKIVILAACYGMSAERLRVQCRSWGMPDPGEREASEILSGYHARNPSVKRVWFDMIKKAVQAIDQRTRLTWGPLVFQYAARADKAFLCVRLPSGREKYYADVRIEDNGRGWKTFSYLDPLRGFRQTVRPASLYENIVQAVAVDVSFEKALAVNRFADIKLIIHDELIVSAKKDSVDRIKKEMKRPVPWLPGMPVASKTAVCLSYHKGDSIK